MNKNVILGVVIAIVLLALGWWYWAFMMPVPGAPTLTQETVSTSTETAPEEAVFPLTGTWKSVEDSRFIRTFSEDGTVTDQYEGDESATVSGSWNVVENPNAEQPEFASLNGMRAIKIQFPEEVLYFAVVKLTDDTLELSYLARGNTLAFTRVR